jgi:hypothetical protein
MLNFFSIKRGAAAGVEDWTLKQVQGDGEGTAPVAPAGI